MIYSPALLNCQSVTITVIMDGLELAYHNIQPPKFIDSRINCILHVDLLPYIGFDSRSLDVRKALLDKSRCLLDRFEVDIN